MKRLSLVAVVMTIVAISLSAFAEELKVNYRDFTLGQGRDEVKKILASKYAGGAVKFYTGGDILVTPDNMLQVYLYFDQKNVLFNIHVQLKYGDITEVKKRIVEKYSQPNDYPGEEFDEGNKLYLMGRWLVEKKFKISLWESFYCRNQKMMPCVVEVDYLDVKRKEDKDAYERSQKEDAKKKKDAKTYDGF